MDRFRVLSLSGTALLSITSLLIGCSSDTKDFGVFTPYGCDEVGLSSQKIVNKIVPFNLEQLSVDDKVLLDISYSCLEEVGSGTVRDRLLGYIGVTVGQLDLLKKRSTIGAHSFVIADKSLIEVNQVLEHECVAGFQREEKLSLVGVVDDPYFSNQLHLGSIGLVSVWDQFWQADIIPAVSSKVIVAIIDSGIDLAHEDLVANLWTNTAETDGNGQDDDGNGYIDDVQGYNFAQDIADPSHAVAASDGAIGYHGTAVAGIAGAVSGNTIGVSGVMGAQIEIMPLNVSGTSDSMALADIAAAIRYAANNGADVINLSLGGLGAAPTTKTAIQEAIDLGVTVIAAAGNDGVEIVSYPARYAIDMDGFISVAASLSDTYGLASYSSFDSAYVEIAAPGSDSLTANGLKGLLTTMPDNKYDRMDGTSSASPVVAGAAALVIAKARVLGQTLTPAQVEEQLKLATTQYKSLSGKVSQCRHLDFAKIQ